MDRILHFFETLQAHPLQRMGILIGGLLFFWILEGAIPLLPLRFRKTRVRYAGINLFFTFMHLIIHGLLALVIIIISDWCRQHQFGLVYWLDAGIGLTLLVSFLTLDFFVGWLVHITQHKAPFLWRFHIIHHADTNVDATTGLRHHPAESLLRGLFFFAGVWISGAPIVAVMLYQTVLVFATAFTHANIRLPDWLDAGIGYVLVSPNMHKVHHHWKQPYTDSNYGAVLSVWDRLLGTLTTLRPSEIRYGLDRNFPGERDEDQATLLKAPFRKLHTD
jgi:sterol desaturase/sphingolipid hydroxylase (fatty acid hydroxylase superfamily)